MMAAVQQQQRTEDVGRILVQVQEDLKQLKEQFGSSNAAGSGIDIKALDQALLKTEKGIQQNTEYIVGVLNNQVTTLPTVGEPHHGQQRGVRYQDESPHRRPQHHERPVLHKTLHHDSPGENFHQNLTMKALFNPENLFNRQALHKGYGLVLPKIGGARQTKISTQSVTKGITIDPLSVLPRANRIDPALPPPSIAERDAKKGILSLIERGLIPPAAELTLDPSPVHHRKAPIHNFAESARKQLHSNCSTRGEDSHYMASVKLDLTLGGDNRYQPTRTDTRGSQHLGTTDDVLSIPPSSATTGTRSPQLRSVMIKSPSIRRKSAISAVSEATKSPVAMRVFDAPLQPLPPPVTPVPNNSVQVIPAMISSGSSGEYNFILRDGIMPANSDPEFSSFHERHLLQWGSILKLITQLTKVLREYAVPAALVNGTRLADLSSQYELEHVPERVELLGVLDNFDEVLALINTPGRRYRTLNGKHIAATKIQSMWKRYVNRCAYLKYRQQRWAAGVIAISWIMHVRMARMRKQLRVIRKRHLDNFIVRQKSLAADWDRISKARRVIVHVPSLGYSAKQRFTLPGLNRKQNAQMARLCDLSDPNVDVIYVSPVEVLDELHQYYCRLLGLREAVDKGDPEQIGDLTSRFTVITPEALNKFPTHQMCLASLLKYSPNAINRIKKLIAGRPAYYVPGVMHKDDLAVADALNLPVLGCEPEICHLYSSKSGGQRVFAAAGVSTAPGEHDVYTPQQLHENMSRLICEYPYVKRWLMKLDGTFNGRGIAYVDVGTYLQCHSWIVKESLRYGDKWCKKWAQDAAYNKVLAELPEVLDNYAQPSCPDVFPTWADFLDAFFSQGGIIEACPPSDSVTCLTCDMLIEPTGNVRMMSCGDQIHGDNVLKCWGTSVPQTSVDPSDFYDTSLKIGEACRSRGVVGYFSIDYVTFIDPVTLKQGLWATDLTLRYSNQMAMTQLMLFITKGSLDAARCKLVVPPPHKEKKGRFRKREEAPKPEPNLNRFAVMSTNLLHTNMAVVHYSVFFQMCRAHGIGYDIKERQGSVFTLVDSSKREEMGMLSVCDQLPGTLASFARNLSIIHQEISAPNMQGRTNFKAAIDDIEAILGTTAENEKDTDNDNAPTTTPQP